MSAPVHTPASPPPSMDPMRRTSRAAGILYLTTFVAVPTLMVFQPVRDGAEFVFGSGSATAVLWRSFSEVVAALAAIGTAAVLFSLTKRVSETVALGFVTARVAEGTL